MDFSSILWVNNVFGRWKRIFRNRSIDCVPEQYYWTPTVRNSTLHTTHTENLVFLHNGDFSGDVEFFIDRVPSNSDLPKVVIGNRGPDDNPGYWVRVPMSDLKDLFVAYLQHRMIQNIEQMDTDEFLDFLVYSDDDRMKVVHPELDD